MDFQSRKSWIEENTYEMDNAPVEQSNMKYSSLNNMDVEWFNIIDSLFTDLKEYVHHHSIPILNNPHASTHFISEFYPLIN